MLRKFKAGSSKGYVSRAVIRGSETQTPKGNMATQ